MIQRIKNKVNALRADPHMREVASGMVLAFSLKVIGAGLAFGFNVAIARLLGAEGAGLYFLALSVTAIGSVIGRAGLDNALLRFVATHAAHDEWGKVKGVYALGIRIAIIASSTITIIIFLASPWIALVLFNKPELTELLRWMSLSILPFSLLNLHSECLKGLKRTRDAILVQSVGLPLISLLLIYPLIQFAGVIGLAWSYAAGTVIVAVLGFWFWHRPMARRVEAKIIFPHRMLWLSCRPLFMVSVMSRAVLPWAPIFLLGIWVNSVEVGVFGVASRVAMLVNFMLMTMNNVLAPKFAELYSKGDMDVLGDTARNSALIITMLASPIFLILIFWGEWVMMVFGPEFKQGVFVLAIMAMGQFVNAMTGSVGFVMMMGGKEAQTWHALLWSVLVLFILAVALVPLLGIVGCALAVAASEICKNIILVVFCRRELGIWVVPFIKRSNR